MRYATSSDQMRRFPGPLSGAKESFLEAASAWATLAEEGENQCARRGAEGHIGPADIFALHEGWLSSSAVGGVLGQSACAIISGWCVQCRSLHSNDQHSQAETGAYFLQLLSPIFHFLCW
mmetsp:Transcript_5009/g.7362  ORF Transcript_5009/g.7362 Transcript_5009/m.7362 type:complete len:120 (-) Transcript_5009:169-528(-)